MLENKTIAVVVPAYNEASQIAMVIESMPAFVDRIVVVDDASKDETGAVVRSLIDEEVDHEVFIPHGMLPIVPNRYNRADIVARGLRKEHDKQLIPVDEYLPRGERARTVLLTHKRNGSVGAAIASGYRWCRDRGIDLVAVMAGDGQMDPSELEMLCRVILDHPDIDYVKGNRLAHPAGQEVIPGIRYLGNSVLSLLTKIASGYWRISDTQTGYTVVNKRALEKVHLHEIYPSYGCPNDILVKLNIAGCKVAEVPIKPVYQVGEQSKMKVFKVIPRISLLLCKGFFNRLYIKYFLRDFHPLFLLYHLGFFLLLIDIPFFIEVLLSLHPEILLPMQSLVIFVFLTISGLQMLFFAMWMDMLDNDRLQADLVVGSEGDVASRESNNETTLVRKVV